MRCLHVFLYAFLVFSCQTNKDVKAAVSSKTIATNVSSSYCPEDGTCTFEVLKNKKFNLLTDPYGARYPEILDGDKTILKFEYKRRPLPNIEDSNYREIIYIQLEGDNKELNLENQALKAVNVVFARLCYCRGQTGYYPVYEGELLLKKQETGLYLLNLRFKINEVPQIITNIEEQISL